MKQEDFTLQMVNPKDFRLSVGVWIRAARQRAMCTQAMLASRAGVPASSLARLERQGAGSLELFSRVLFALGEIDALDALVQTRLRLARLPADLSQLPQSREMPKRIRPKGNAR
jgi:transcriptional regulator with XRE-family HTH domain